MFACSEEALLLMFVDVQGWLRPEQVVSSVLSSSRCPISRAQEAPTSLVASWMRAVLVIDPGW